MSYQGGMNAQARLSRESGDVQGGARFGAAPWQVGVLAALLLVFEIFVGAHSVKTPGRRDLQVAPESLRFASWHFVSCLFIFKNPTSLVGAIIAKSGPEAEAYSYCFGRCSR